ncbi:MAG: hypothetical protein LUG61_06240 [Lachnospiraceae bacterium]|nr:hypothetical protein [Lachnospiraceae bacterium]
MSDILKRFWNTVKQSTAWKVFVILELIVVLILLLKCFAGRCDYTYVPGNMEVMSDLVQVTADEEGTAAYYVSDAEAISETVILCDDGQIRLIPGAYRITIYYLSQVNTTEVANINNGNGNLYLTSENNSVYLDYQTLYLRNGMDSNSTTFRVSAPGAIDDISLSVTFTGAGELTVYSVAIREIVAYRYVKLLAAILLFGFLDIAGFLLFTDKAFQRKKELGVLILICLAGMLPFFADYVIWGHDLGFHLYRILLFAYELSIGHYFPAIYTASLNGFGDASPIFYGQTFLYLPAILYNCGVSVSVAYNIYICAVTLATCLITYFSARKIFRKPDSALFAAAMYTLGAGRLTNILTRSAVGVYTVQTFLPLVVLGFYNIYTAKKGEKITIGKYLPIVIGLTGVVLSHTLTIFMGALMIALVCVILYKKTFEPQRFLALCRAAALTLLMSLAALVPLLDGMTWDIQVNHVVNRIQTTGAYLVQMLNPIVNNYQEYNVNGSASNEMSLALGGPIVVGLVLYLVFLVLRKRKREEEADSAVSGFSGLCFGLSVLTLFLSSIYMFYDYLDFLPEVLYSALTSYEYSWRWLTFAALFGIFCTTAVLDSGELKQAFPRVPWMVFLCALLIINTGQIYSNQLYTSDMQRASNNYVDYHYYSYGEFQLYPTDRTQVFSRELLYDAETLLVGDYTCQDGECVIALENLTDQNATVDIPMFAYDHYVAYDVETGETIEITRGENSRIRLNLPAGYTGTVKVEYHLSTLWAVCIVISLLTDALLIAYALFEKRRSPAKRNKAASADGIVEA